MSVKLTTLKTEISDIADRLEALTGLETRSAKDELEIDSLTVRSEEARNELTREEDLQKRMAGLRAVSGRSSPKTSPANNAHAIQPGQFHYRELSCFPGPNGERDAYRAGQFYLATIYGVDSAKRYCQENGIFSRALPADGQVEGDPERGGNLTNPEFLSTILRNVDQYGTFPREAFRQPMKSHTLSVPRRTKGVSAFYVDEGNEIQREQAKWDRVSLVAKKAAVIVPLTTEVMEDSIPDIGQAVTEEISLAFATKADEDGFLGDGGAAAGDFWGIIPKLLEPGHEASIITAGAGETGFESMMLDTFIKAIALLPRWAKANAKWITICTD